MVDGGRNESHLLGVGLARERREGAIDDPKAQESHCRKVHWVRHLLGCPDGEA